MEKEELKALRLDARMTQKQMAAYLGLHLRTIGQYEQGRRPIPLIVDKMLGNLKARRHIKKTT